MPVLALRFLAGAAAAYSIGGFLVLRRTRWLESEFLIVTVLIYGVALVAAILIQTELIDWSKPVAWAFVGIVSYATLIGIYYLWKMRREAAPESGQDLNAYQKIFLLTLEVLALAVGLFVYIAPKSAGFVWPWSELPAWKLLDSRLIASMLLTVAGGALLVLFRNDRGALQIFTFMLWAYILVAGAGIALHAASTPAFVTQDIIYLVIFGLIFVAGLASILQTRTRRQNRRLD
jgi:hypothetical protein